ncbi:MAG: HEAT repeat domain-containing protein [Candidatus Wallbacteria bacterium]|nr:HEAT repeat domain-containing protein [Candidatus Wallbacteria bacterium]
MDVLPVTAEKPITPPPSNAGSYRFREFLENLLALLSDDNESIITYAARALKDYDTQEVRSGLMLRLADCPPACVGEMIATLESLHQDECDELFHLLTRSPSADVRAVAIDRLGKKLPSSEAAAVLEMLEAENDARCIASLLSLLGRLAPEYPASRFAPFLEAQDPRVRANAVELLEKLPVPSEETLVEPLLGDPAPRVRANAMRLLWPRQREKLWASLLDELASKDENRELSAVYLLGQVPIPPEGAALLVDRLKSPSQQVRMLASRSLLTCQVPIDAAPLCALYMEEANEVIRRNLMACCRRCDPDNAIRAFATMLGNTALQPETRATAARALGDLAHADAIPALVTHLKDSDARVRSNVVEALEHCPYEGMQEILLPCLEDTTPRVQATAAMVLWRLGGRQAIDTLLKMLRSNDPRKQASAAFALGEIGSVELVAPLSELLENLAAGVVMTEAQRRVQKNVMQALTKIRSR